MQWSDEVKIETPELVEVSLEVAGLGSRFVAQLVDWLVKWGILAILSFLVLVILVLLGATERFSSASVLLGALAIGLSYAFLLGFDIYYEVRHNGQTPGKKFAGIRVLREGGGPLDFQSACIRNLLGLVDFLPVFYLLGGLLVLLTPRGQRLGDLAAGTIVVRERAVKPPADLQATVDQLASGDLTFTPDQLAACSVGDRNILRSFFQRFEDMEAPARDLLARKLANTFLDKLSYDPSFLLPAENFLASLYRDLETFHKAGRG